MNKKVLIFSTYHSELSDIYNFSLRHFMLKEEKKKNNTTEQRSTFEGKNLHK